MTNYILIFCLASMCSSHSHRRVFLMFINGIKSYRLRMRRCRQHHACQLEWAYLYTLIIQTLRQPNCPVLSNCFPHRRLCLAIMAQWGVVQRACSSKIAGNAQCLSYPAREPIILCFYEQCTRNKRLKIKSVAFGSYLHGALVDMHLGVCPIVHHCHR